MLKNVWIRKIRLISNHDLVNKTIAIHIMTNIARRKGNQEMKFSQLIEYKMRNIFLEISSTKCRGKGVSRPFSKNLACLWINSLKFYTVCFYHMPS